MGFAEGFVKGLDSAMSSKKSSSTTGKSNSSGGLGSEIRNGVAKIFSGGKSGRSMNSSADTAKEYSGVDSGDDYTGGSQG